MIYFITAREIGRVKIGFSDEPRSRFIKMRTDSPVPLALERICDGDLLDEFALHRRFQSDRLSGEWFKLSAAILAHMDTLPEFKRKPRKITGTPLGDWIAREGLTLSQFAERVGTTQATISRIMSGKSGGSIENLRSIILATNCEVSADDILFAHLPLAHPAQDATA